MMFPEKIDATWISSLDDKELRQAESELRARLAVEEKAERSIRGSRYDLMRGPASLMNAWMRWSMVNNAAQSRGVRVLYRR
jgi:hypothetical protein